RPAPLRAGRRGSRPDAHRGGHRPHRLLRARLSRARAHRRAGRLPRLAGMTAGASAFEQALDQLGAAIVGGELEAGAADTIEGFIARTGASRSVVREVTR